MTEDLSLTLDCIFLHLGQKPVLQGVHVRARPGRICGIFGVNGTGKSSLFKIAAGQLRPSSGHTVIDGKSYLSPSPWRRSKKIAFLPQEPFLPPGLRVRQVLSSSRRHAELLGEGFWEKLLGMKVGNLSGGERRYLELEWVLRLEQPYVILDEPFGGLSPLVTERMAAAVKKAAEGGRGILIGEHNYRALSAIADDAYLFSGTRSKLLDPARPWLRQLVEAGYCPASPWDNESYEEDEDKPATQD